MSLSELEKGCNMIVYRNRGKDYSRSKKKERLSSCLAKTEWSSNMVAALSPQQEIKGCERLEKSADGERLAVPGTGRGGRP